MMGDSTLDARQHYLSLGLDLAPDFKEAPDHVVAELEFMQVLVAESLTAIAAGDQERLRACLKHQEIFLENHLGAWMPALAEKIIEHAQTPFYRHLALTARRFIAEEIEALSGLGAIVQAEAG
jgi:TorA maturation chaperone TorD